MSSLLTELNDQQQQAVLHPGGPAVVLAGAGSGKTRVLTTRVAWLIKEQQVQPDQILLVTFTNKAAQEMSQRVAELAQEFMPYAGTFHRICALILRRHGKQIGLNPNYTIYDAQDQESLIKQIYRDHNFNHQKYNRRAIKAAISQAKNKMQSAAAVKKLAETEFELHLARVYQLYQRHLDQNQAVDFDDLLTKAVELFSTQSSILDKYQRQFLHVLVDEYQDTNTVQYQLTKLLTKPQNNVYVVGDFSQSIYAWRGADYHNLERLTADFKNIEHYRLERNYRSTQTILDAATQVISQNTGHPILKLWTDNTDRESLVLFKTNNNRDEATQVMREIRRLNGDYQYRDVAILYRTNAQSRSFEEACVKLGIPYQLIGGFKFYERQEIKDVLAYLRVLLNPTDTVSYQRLQKIGKRRLANFKNWADHQRATELTPLQALEGILKSSRYLKKYDDQDTQDQSRLENIQELLNVASQFQDIAVFLENVALVQDNHLADVESSNHLNAVTMMSLHSAKGLEFPVVFMVGMEEGLLPHSRSMYDANQLEEERRLCYVGITRAQKKLYFSLASQRWQYGHSSSSTPSRFLHDIEPHLFANPSQLLTDNDSASGNSTSGRRLVLDDEVLDSVLSGEMDVDLFLDS